MTILPTDIKLLESERMRDTTDGGGRQTSRVIQSGVVGNIFPKVSRLDAVYGRVNLRKIYVAVRTATLDMYGGAHLIITDPPDNDRISCVLFSTKSAFDVRTAARNRIESYVVQGPLSRMRLYGNQVVGAKAITTYQRTEETLPDVGAVFCLSIEAGGYSSYQQYVRVTDVEHEVRTFTDNAGDYSRRVLTLQLSSTLDQDFPGAEVTRYASDASPTKIRDTSVADTSRYFGIQPIAEPALAGAMTIKLNSVYAPLVPSTQRESALSMVSTSGVTSYLSTSTSSMIFYAGGVPSSSSLPKTYQLPRSIIPGTVRVGNSTNSGGIDNGEGVIVRGTSFWLEGTVDYDAGTVTLTAASFSGGSLYIYYGPQAVVSSAAHTRSLPVSLTTRGTVYAETLSPVPSPGSTTVDFRALGKWYRLKDDGTGRLSGADESEGTGTVNYVTGAVVVTLGALPDVESSIIFSWGGSVHFERHTSATLTGDSIPIIPITLAHSPVVKGSVTVSYSINGGNFSISQNASGTFTSSYSHVDVLRSYVDHANGVVYLVFNNTPFSGTGIGVSYTWRDGADVFSESTAAPVVGGQFTVPGPAPFLNSGSMSLGLANGISVSASISSGGGLYVSSRRRTSNDPLSWEGQQVGAFNSTTGVVTITNGLTIRETSFVQNGTDQSGWPIQEWQDTTTAVAVVSASAMRVETDGTGSPFVVTNEMTPYSDILYRYRFALGAGGYVVPGSVIIYSAGSASSRFYDRGDGVMVQNSQSLTSATTVAGTIDYESATVEIKWSSMNGGSSTNMDLVGCIIANGEHWVDSISFRTAGSPLRPASFFVQGTGLDGTLASGTANVNGVVSGSFVRGSVNATMGVATVEFGQEVGGVWEPLKVDPGSIKYNGVVLSNLPLDASVLGLDPVRLPADGRVPIYRAGDVAVLHNTQMTALPNPVSAGGVYNVGRGDLATVKLLDSLGAVIDESRYTVDLATGDIEIGGGWTGAGGNEPIQAVHRIEQMVLLTDAQLTGEVSLSAPVDRDYPVSGTYLSGALLFGDMQAYVTNVFDQASWTSVWADAVSGSGSNAQYDDVNFPIEVLNESAVTERWRISFTSSTAYQVIGENLGVIATGTTSADCGPTSPVTGDAYFVIRAGGWGLGWSAGNQLRFNTIGANGPTWIARTILAGATLEGDSFDLEARGDVD